MAKINLLPWREELREQRNKEYYAVLGLTAAVAFFTGLSGQWLLPGASGKPERTQ